MFRLGIERRQEPPADISLRGDRGPAHRSPLSRCLLEERRVRFGMAYPEDIHRMSDVFRVARHVSVSVRPSRLFEFRLFRFSPRAFTLIADFAILHHRPCL